MPRHETTLNGNYRKPGFVGANVMDSQTRRVVLQARPQSWLMRLAFLALCLAMSGCVTSNNQCGNEQRDWANLSFPKGSYCSVPAFVPLSKRYEQANKAVCKVHDNNRGRASTITRSEADWRFLCDYIKRSELPWGARHVTGYISYLAVRLVAPDDSAQQHSKKHGARNNLTQDPLTRSPALDFRD